MEALLPLALLACPVGMGLMMWFMWRAGKSQAQQPSGDSLPDLKVEQAQLAQRIEALEGDRAAEVKASVESR